MALDFERLQPKIILQAVEWAGFHPTGEISQLNSYENRVFDIRLESPLKVQPATATKANADRKPNGVFDGHAHPTQIIVKFYRPHRWSREAIQDEHDFLRDLKSEGVAAVAPIELPNGQTLFHHDGFEVAIFPKIRGRMPDEFLPGQLRQVGRTLARIHNVGSQRKALHRPTMTADFYGWNALNKLEKFVYPELWKSYEEASRKILEELEEELNPESYIRIHGDCHKGNLLSLGHSPLLSLENMASLSSPPSEFLFVDFDDCCNGPAIQDFWMLFSGALEDEHTKNEQDEICEGYEELRSIPDEWYLIEPLRGLRIIHYAGWIAHRWTDPSFQRLFPHFTTYNYWLDELKRLEQIARF